MNHKYYNHRHQQQPQTNINNEPVIFIQMMMMISKFIQISKLCLISPLFLLLLMMMMLVVMIPSISGQSWQSSLTIQKFALINRCSSADREAMFRCEERAQYTWNVRDTDYVSNCNECNFCC